MREYDDAANECNAGIDSKGKKTCNVRYVPKNNPSLTPNSQFHEAPMHFLNVDSSNFVYININGKWPVC